MPLHAVVVDHLRKIQSPPRKLVWPWRRNQEAPDKIKKLGTFLYRQWHQLRKAAGIDRRVTPHDMRRTCGSALFAISPAAASECLQHSSIVTTQRSYANVTRETHRLMIEREQPETFAAGAGVSPAPPLPSAPLPSAPTVDFTQQLSALVLSEQQRRMIFELACALAGASAASSASARGA